MPIPKKLVAPENAIARIEGAFGAAAPSTPWHFSINVGFGGEFWSSSSTWYLGALRDTHRRLRDPEAATRARARPNIPSGFGIKSKHFSRTSVRELRPCPGSLSGSPASKSPGPYCYAVPVTPVLRGMK